MIKMSLSVSSLCSWELVQHVPLPSDPVISSKSSAGFESKRSTAWELARLVTPLSWRRSPCPHSRPAWSAPPSAIRPSGSNGAMAQPKPPPQMPSSISCRWKTRAAGQWLFSQLGGSDLTKNELIRKKQTKNAYICSQKWWSYFIFSHGWVTP